MEETTTDSSLFPITGDRELVARLIADDAAAWGHVRVDMIEPVVAANVKGMLEMLKRRSIDPASVPGRVYEDLKKDDWTALRNFRFECSFKSFLYWRIYNAAQALIRETVRVREVQVLDSEDGTDIIESAPAPDTTISAMLIRDAVQVANQALAGLWEENSTYALVLLMRNDLVLPAKEVADILQKQGNTVDQINIRAQKALRKHRNRLLSGNNVSYYPSEDR